jgi:hypothetical protein
VYSKGADAKSIVYFTENRKWRFSLGRVRVVFDKPLADGWRAGYAVVTVPHGADGFALQMGGAATGKVWYDDISAYKLR